jgi:hypothetical protein
MKFSSLWKSTVLAGAVALALGMSACNDDPAGPDPNAGRKASVTLMNVNTDVASVNFADGTELISTAQPYGDTKVVQVQVGTRTIAVKTTGGSALSSVGVQVDTNRPTWVISAGTLAAPAAIGIDAAKNNAAIAAALSNGDALVRFVNASHNAGNASLKQGTAFGTVIGNNIAYKGVSDFSLIDTSEKALVLIKGAGTSNDTLAVAPVAAQLAAGKMYTVVLYGSSDATAAPAQRLMAKIVSEP